MEIKLKAFKRLDRDESLKIVIELHGDRQLV